VNVIAFERQAGKTRALIEFMAQPRNEDVLYLAPTAQQATNAHHMAVGLGFLEPHDRRRFLSVSQIVDRIDFRRGGPARFVVDELDGVLRLLLNGTVDLAAFTPSGDARMPEPHRAPHPTFDTRSLIGDIL